MPRVAGAMNAPFEDSRRLTGANLYFDVPGVALETAPGVACDAATLQRWRDNVARARAAIGWPDGAVAVRRHATGTSLAFAAPPDQLYVATEANEWALHAALGLRADDTPVDDDDPEPRPHVAHFDDDHALARLRMLARAEANPALMELLDAARGHGLPAHADDDTLSIGEGTGARHRQSARHYHNRRGGHTVGDGNHAREHHRRLAPAFTDVALVTAGLPERTANLVCRVQRHASGPLVKPEYLVAGLDGRCAWVQEAAYSVEDAH